MPACEAVTTTVPAPVKVSGLPLSVAGPDTVKLTGRFEVALELSAIGPAPYVTELAGAANVMDCAASVISSVALGLVVME